MLSGCQPTTPGDDNGTWWRPGIGLSWHIQYAGEIDLSLPVQVYNLDWDATSTEQVAALKARGVRSICYLSAGSWEDWRPDAGQFSVSLLGRELDGWPGERWLDVRQADELLPILAARMDTCRDKGFDAVDADNVDGYTNDTGFDLTPRDQADYIRSLADLAHQRGLAFGLKNDIDQVAELTDAVDFATNEECLAYHECGAYESFIARGRPVFHIEYEGAWGDICAASPSGFSTVLAPKMLDGPLQSC